VLPQFAESPWRAGRPFHLITPGRGRFHFCGGVRLVFSFPGSLRGRPVFSAAALSSNQRGRCALAGATPLLVLLFSRPEMETSELARNHSWNPKQTTFLDWREPSRKREPSSNSGFETAEPLGWVFWDREGAEHRGPRHLEAYTGTATCVLRESTRDGPSSRLPEGRFIELEPSTDYYIGTINFGRRSRFVSVSWSGICGRTRMMAVQAVESHRSKNLVKALAQYGALFRTQPGT